MFQTWNTACGAAKRHPGRLSMCYVLHIVVVLRQQGLGCRQDFKAAWQRAAADTDWQQLAESSQQASDHEVNSVLCQTQICHAAQICYADPVRNLAQAFPLEAVMDMLLELTGSKQDPVMRRLVEAALHHGESASALII